MFYDERIHDGRGRAFRNTLIFATVLFFLYTVLHAVYIVTTLPDFKFIAIITEALFTLIGASMLLYGELSFGGRHPDEMQLYRKNCYYAKVFYIFLYSVAGIYCVTAPIFILTPDVGIYPPSTALMLTEIPCWLFLMLQFKRHEMPMNHEFLAEKKNIYWKRVLKNILKFGGYCVCFTCLSFVTTFFYLSANGSDMGTFDISVLISVLLTGLCAWLSFSLEYLLFSFAERVSDRATQKNVISGITVTFMWLGLGSDILFKAVMIAVLASGNSFNSVTAATAMSYLKKTFGWGTICFCGLFTVYFLSELRHLSDKKLTNVLSASLILGTVQYTSSIFYPIVSVILSTEKKGDFGIKLSMLNICIAVFAVISIVFAALSLYLLISQFKCLSEHGFAQIWYCAVPTLSFLVIFAELLLGNILMRDFNHIVLYLVHIAVSISQGVLYCRIFKRIKKASALAEKNETVS